MYALDKIVENANIEKLLEHYGFDISNQNGNMIRSKCVIHGGHNPTEFVINEEDGLWYCHSGGCGGGDIFTLVSMMEEISFPEAIKWLSNFYGVDISNMELVEHKTKLKRELDSFMKIMQKKRKKTSIKEYVVNDEVRAVRKFRDFKEETLDHFKLGHVDSIKLLKSNGDTYTLRNRLVFPIIYNGLQVGVSLRRIRNKDYPKWSHQPISIKTNELLYNYDATKGVKEVIIVEGMPDVWAYHEIGLVAVATFGSHITDKQYKLLLKTGADLIFSFDGDNAGETATNTAIELFRNKANMYKVQFDEGQDPASITREELLSRYEKRTRRI